jgi:hypothetical protein
MGRNANEVESNAKPTMVAPLLLANAYAARVAQIVFVGVQKQRPWKGEVKDPIDMVRVTYEMSHEFMHEAVEDTSDSDTDYIAGDPMADKPRWFTEDMPFHSLKADRAKSTKRYNVLDPQGTHGGQWRPLLSSACNAVLIQNPGKGANAGKIYNNVADVTPMGNMPGYVQPEMINAPFYYDPMDDSCTLEEFRSLPEFVQNIILKADDHGGSVLAKQMAANGGSDAGKPSDSGDTGSQPSGADSNTPPPQGNDSADGNNPFAGG